MRTRHSLASFDALFRAVGPLLPLLPLGLRVAGGIVAPPTAGGGHTGRAPPTAAAPPAACLAAYTLVALARLLLYFAHLLLQRALSGHGAPKGGWLSDHIFLGASVAACLCVELCCCVADGRACLAPGATEGISNSSGATPHAATMVQHPAATPASSPLRAGLVAAAGVAAAALYAALCADMYYTCRFFHAPTESVAALAMGLLAFQGPLLTWLERAHARMGAGAVLA
ncbi:hypothetical protein FOA52_014542 [Chlamydomonas sp. UWO 241]|nr:hypothetical protein FOA52_014542 [Chlamydomonas sp. UWO 241]